MDTLESIEFDNITRRNCGITAYGNCKHGSSASMGMMGSSWICLNFFHRTLYDFMTLQSNHFQESTALEIIKLKLSKLSDGSIRTQGL